MTPTSLRLPPALKERIEDLATEAGMTFHGYLLDIVDKATEQAAKRKDFVAAALASRADFAQTGLGYRFKDVHRYLDQRAAKKKPARPKPVEWRK